MHDYLCFHLQLNSITNGEFIPLNIYRPHYTRAGKQPVGNNAQLSSRVLY